MASSPDSSSSQSCEGSPQVEYHEPTENAEHLTDPHTSAVEMNDHTNYGTLPNVDQPRLCYQGYVIAFVLVQNEKPNDLLSRAVSTLTPLPSNDFLNGSRIVLLSNTNNQMEVDDETQNSGKCDERSLPTQDKETISTDSQLSDDISDNIGSSSVCDQEKCCTQPYEEKTPEIQVGQNGIFTSQLSNESLMNTAFPDASNAIISLRNECSKVLQSKQLWEGKTFQSECGLPTPQLSNENPEILNTRMSLPVINLGNNCFANALCEHAENTADDVLNLVDDDSHVTLPFPDDLNNISFDATVPLTEQEFNYLLSDF